MKSFPPNITFKNYGKINVWKWKTYIEEKYVENEMLRAMNLKITNTFKIKIHKNTLKMKISLKMKEKRDKK